MVPVPVMVCVPAIGTGNLLPKVKYCMMLVVPTAAVCRVRSSTKSPAGMVEKVAVFVPSLYATLDADAENVFSIRIRGGALPPAKNAVPQVALFSAILFQNGSSKQVNTNRKRLSHHCRILGSGSWVQMQVKYLF